MWLNLQLDHIVFGGPVVVALPCIRLHGCGTLRVAVCEGVRWQTAITGSIYSHRRYHPHRGIPAKSSPGFTFWRVLHLYSRLQGRRAENQGLGIGANAYYRRVVENQKGGIIEAILKAARRLDAKSDVIATLEDAAKQNQFTAEVEDIRLAIPEWLLIKGHSPLLLLHNALIEGYMHRVTTSA